MSEPGISVKEFRQILREGVQRACKDNGWNYDNQTERGYAFQFWAAQVIADLEQTFDTDPGDAMILAQDLKADLVFEDTNANHLLICQCKHMSQSGSVDESEVNDFFHRHRLFMDRDWVRQHGSAGAATALLDYSERIDSGWSVSYYFLSNGTASERTKELERKGNDEYSAIGLPIQCRLLDFGPLKEYCVQSRTLEQSVPSVIELDLPQGRFFEKQSPHKTIVAVIKGNALAGLAKRYRQSLYAWNIRGYLGNRGINQAISRTATEHPDSFFYFNNGVSAICTDYSLNGNHVRAKNLQVINGAQTISSLANQAENVDIEVLFRLTKTESVKTEKGFNQQIILYNNSQNLVKVSDFRSNDEIQLFLEQELANRKAKGPLPKLRYVRKRAVGRRGIGNAIKLEEMAKIRYSFLFEPTLVHAAPKSLWSLSDSGGVYERAFGVDGKIETAWSQRTLDDALLAIAFYLEIDKAAKELGKQDPELRFLRRLRFHAVALAGEFARRRFEPDEARSLVTSKPKFVEAWTSFWPMAKGVLIDVFSSAEDEGTSMFAFVRSSERWQQMTKRLRRHLAAL